MASRLDVRKTYKLFIDGAFPRSESGRSLPVTRADGTVVAHLCRASRKDLREGVEAARRALDKWSAASAYNRGQVLYRMAEMMEGKRRELEDAVMAVSAVRAGPGSVKRRDMQKEAAAREVAVSIDRLIYYAGWADKYAQVLGCNNPVSGPYYNFTIAEPTGVVAVVAPDAHPLLAFVSLIAPVVCAGNTVVALASQSNPIPAAVLGEVCATSDVPGGVINILTGERAELLKFIAPHRDIDAIHAADLAPEEITLLREGAAENVKRVTVRSGQRAARGTDWLSEACNDPSWIEPFVEMKTIWHPASV